MMGNVLFKSLVNRCKTVYSYQSVKREDGSTGFSAAELETGVISICKALSGTYRDLDGKRKQIQGDITKVKYAISDEAGLRLLKNLEHTSMQIPGTVEIRKIMRYATNAGRVRRGVPIFITWSPDEKHNVLMLRLSRSRLNDTLNAVDTVHRKIGALRMPPIDKDYVDMHIPQEKILEWMTS